MSFVRCVTLTTLLVLVMLHYSIAQYYDPRYQQTYGQGYGQGYDRYRPSYGQGYYGQVYQDYGQYGGQEHQRFPRRY